MKRGQSHCPRQALQQPHNLQGMLHGVWGLVLQVLCGVGAFSTPHSSKFQAIIPARAGSVQKGVFKVHPFSLTLLLQLGFLLILSSPASCCSSSAAPL